MVKMKHILMLGVFACLVMSFSAEARHHRSCSSFGINVGLQSGPCYAPAYVRPVPAYYPQRTVVIQESYPGYDCNAVYVVPAAPCVAAPVRVVPECAPSSASVSFSWFNTRWR